MPFGRIFLIVIEFPVVVIMANIPFFYL
jgi:hypothetical protein